MRYPPMAMRGYLGSCIPFLVALIALRVKAGYIRVLPDLFPGMIGFGDGSLVAEGDAAVAEGVSAEELRGNENGYRWS